MCCAAERSLNDQTTPCKPCEMTMKCLIASVLTTPSPDKSSPPFYIRNSLHLLIASAAVCTVTPQRPHCAFLFCLICLQAICLNVTLVFDLTPKEIFKNAWFWFVCIHRRLLSMFVFLIFIAYCIGWIITHWCFNRAVVWKDRVWCWRTITTPRQTTPSWRRLGKGIINVGNIWVNCFFKCWGKVIA